MQVFVRRSPIAAPEPDANGLAFNQRRWVAKDFFVPSLGPRKRARQLLPGYAIERAGKSEPPVLVAVASSVNHPVSPVRLPDRRLAQPVLIERAIFPEFEDRVGAQLPPADPIRAASDAETLPARAILAE